MGWLIKKRETKKSGTQYKIWSTISDSYITKKWHSREEILKFLFWNNFRNFVEKFLEESVKFPGNYFEKDTHRRFEVEDEVSDYWHEFIMSTFGKNGTEILVNKFKEEISKIGISLEISDEDYKISNLK